MSTALTQEEMTLPPPIESTRVRSPGPTTAPPAAPVAAPAPQPVVDVPSRRFVGLLARAWPVKQTQWEPYGAAPKSWRPDILLALGILTSTVLLMWPSPLVEFDLWLRKLAFYNKVEWLREVGLLLTYLGSGRVVAPLVLGLAVWCALRYNSIRPLLLFTMCMLPLGAVLGLKHLLGRPLSQRPFRLSELAPEGPVLFSHIDKAAGYIGSATAYPSGHALNTIVLYGLVVMLLGSVMSPRVRWALLLTPPILVVVSQTYVGWHWLFDAPAGFMFGVLIIRGVRRFPWTRMPLGPLQSFEPASPRTIMAGTVIITGVLLSSTFSGYYAIFCSASFAFVGLTWVVVRRRRTLKRAAKAQIS